MTTKYRDRQEVLFNFSQTGVMGHVTPEKEMLADIILRLQRVEAMLIVQQGTAHQWGQDTEYKWCQSCKCSRCSATSSRYAAEQERGMAQNFQTQGRPY